MRIAAVLFIAGMIAAVFVAVTLAAPAPVAHDQVSAVVASPTIPPKKMPQLAQLPED